MANTKLEQIADSRAAKPARNSEFHFYALARANYHWDSGNLGRYLFWAAVETFTRRSNKNFTPSLR